MPRVTRHTVATGETELETKGLRTTFQSCDDFLYRSQMTHDQKIEREMIAFEIRDQRARNAPVSRANCEDELEAQYQLGLQHALQESKTDQNVPPTAGAGRVKVHNNCPP